MAVCLLVCLYVAATGFVAVPVLDTRAVSIPVFALIGIASNLKAESNSSGLDRLAGRHVNTPVTVKLQLRGMRVIVLK